MRRGLSPAWGMSEGEEALNGTEEDRCDRMEIYARAMGLQMGELATRKSHAFARNG